MDELTEDEERWYLRAARAIAGPVKRTYEKDWMSESNCLDDDRFLKRNETSTLAAICKQCPVSINCMEWADKHNPTGVFIAGEWRE